MGSLMSGWNSPVIGNEKKVRMMRNHSLTKEDVDAFWRHQQRKTSEDGATTTSSSPLASPRAGNISPLESPRAGDYSPLASPGRAEEMRHSLRTRLERMSSMPSPLARSAMTKADPYEASCHSEPPSPAAATRAGDVQCFPDPSSGMSSGCWWTRSSWAFLNETPSPEEQKFGRRQTYACVQFHATRIVTGNA
ncbi:hypothetical protein ABZP36_006244 [Zizania latifolia]